MSATNFARKASPAADPIFAKIEAHRTAVQAMNATGDEPSFKAADRVSRKAPRHEMKVLQALFRCRPTTMAGVTSLLDHLRQPQFLRHTHDPETVLSGAHHWFSEQQDGVRTFPHMLAAVVRDLVGYDTPRAS